MWKTCGILAAVFSFVILAVAMIAMKAFVDWLTKD